MSPAKKLWNIRNADKLKAAQEKYRSRCTCIECGATFTTKEANEMEKEARMRAFHFIRIAGRKKTKVVCGDCAA